MEINSNSIINNNIANEFDSIFKISFDFERLKQILTSLQYKQQVHEDKIKSLEKDQDKKTIQDEKYHYSLNAITIVNFNAIL